MAIERTYVCDACGKRAPANDDYTREPVGWGNVYGDRRVSEGTLAEDEAFDLYLCDDDYPRVRTALLAAVKTITEEG
jgi:hypothetical protein